MSQNEGAARELLARITDEQIAAVIMFGFSGLPTPPQVPHEAATQIVHTLASAAPAELALAAARNVRQLLANHLGIGGARH